MMRMLDKRLLATLALVALLAIAGCATDDGDDTAADPVPPADEQVETLQVSFGTLATEDALPFWVAQAEGLFDEAGLEVEIVTFQAAAERDTAMTAGSIDCMMGDIIATALLENGGFPVSMTTVMLGATAEEGRFGIVTSPGSDNAFLDELAGVPVGTSLGTIQEYVVDKLFAQAGVDAADVVKEAVPKVPVRFELLQEGQLAVAALPEPLLSLAEFNGGTIVADDTLGENITQTVLIADDVWLETADGTDAMIRLLEVWDEAVAIINEDPDAWRDTLVEKARLPEPIKDSYAVNAYPMATAPTDEQVSDIVEWMKSVDLLDGDIPYQKLVWEP